MTDGMTDAASLDLTSGKGSPCARCRAFFRVWLHFPDRCAYCEMRAERKRIGLCPDCGAPAWPGAAPCLCQEGRS